MHNHLTELLGHEVAGEVKRVGDALYDVARGRICLSPLTQDAVDEIIETLRNQFGGEVSVTDRMALDNESALVRGLVTAEFKDPELGALYQLQITGHTLIQFYERQFALETNIDGDLMGTVARGIAPATAGGREAPLRLLGQVDQLMARYRELLSEALAADRTATAWDVEAKLLSLTEHVRRVWQLIPHPVKRKLKRIASEPPKSLAAHDRVMRHTIIFALNRADGSLIYDYQHQHNEYEEYEQVLLWVMDIHQAILEFYHRPQHAMAMGRASSVESFLKHYPAHQRVVGPLLMESEAA